MRNITLIDILLILIWFSVYCMLIGFVLILIGSLVGVFKDVWDYLTLYRSKR